MELARVNWSFRVLLRQNDLVTDRVSTTVQAAGDLGSIPSIFLMFLL